MQEDRQGFEALRAILLSAPLPGGRTDEFDDRVTVSADEQDEDDGEYIEGIPPSSYKLWESSNCDGGDHPSTFHSHVAKQTWQVWKRSLVSISALQKIQRRIPQLSSLLAILSGDFRSVEFESWAEEFCAELLYKHPDLRLVDIPLRCQRVMAHYQSKEEQQEGFDEVVISVMKGNAGRVIEVLHELGGGSGAALPAVMTSLLCNLLDHAQIMVQASEKYNLQNRIAAECSFFAHFFLGVRGTPRFGLKIDCAISFAINHLPSITPKADVKIAAFLTNRLEHYAPQTDAEANALLELLRDKVQRQNVRLLDGCVSICLARYLHYKNKEERPGGAVHWLVTGMAMESLIYSSGEGVCERILESYCSATLTSLLQGMLGQEQGVSLTYTTANDMMASLEESSNQVQAVQCLQVIAQMSSAMLNQEISTVLGCIDKCLSKTFSKSVSTLAPSPMHWDMLQLAKGILQLVLSSPDDFQLTVAGIQLLMETFTEVVATRDMLNSPIDENEILEMRETLAEGLMRAFVDENALKKQTPQTSRVNVSGIYSPELGKNSKEKQEIVVRNMLEF